MKRKPFSLLLCIFSMALFLSYHIYYYCINEINNKKVDNYLEEEITLADYPQNSVEKMSKKKDYYGILEIPKINLKQGFYSLNSKKNNVNKNIQLLENNINTDNSIVILAAHSGNSYLGYFKNIDKLLLDDRVYLHYENRKNTYVVSNIYEVSKNGLIEVNHNIHENVLVLTTCSKEKDKQLVVVCKLLADKE